MITDYMNRFGVNLAPAPRNDPALFDPVRVKVLRSFYKNGKPLEVGAVTTLPRADAESLAAIGKVEII